MRARPEDIINDWKVKALRVWEEYEKSNEIVFSVGTASCGRAAGALRTLEAIKDYISKEGIKGKVVEVGCIGFCYAEPIVEIALPGKERMRFGNITADRVNILLDKYLKGGEIPSEFLLDIEKHPMMEKQRRVALRNCGIIDPERIEHYIARDGYRALAIALTKGPEWVIEEIKKSGLRGRGGAGFPTGVKWEIARREKGKIKFVIANADEGDPGAFMDRSLIEGDPHAVLEGLMIAGFAIGACEGYIYIRAEYPLAIKRLEVALEQMKEYGLIGEKILGTNFSFDIHIKQGAGAFVCGEETALIHSIEGKRGMPRVRPPYPAQKGLWGYPTVINNVETLANVPNIIRNGAEWFASYGTEKSKGTKTFALAGKLVRTGLIEVPMGITLREIVYEIGGGIPGNKALKAVQTGGPSGGCIPASMVDLPVDYESLTSAGSIMGSGGMIVMDEESCVVDVARYFLDFTQKESCGKCIPCRVGTRHMVEILDRIREGKGREGDIELLEKLAYTVKNTSLCGLGQTAPNPVLTTIKYFRDEYEAHIKDKRCPAKVCRALIRYYILPDKCVGCLLCLKNCPSGAITGELKKVHVINDEKCIKCGICLEVCPSKIGAVVKLSGRETDG